MIECMVTIVTVTIFIFFLYTVHQKSASKTNWKEQKNEKTDIRKTKDIKESDLLNSELYKGLVKTLRQNRGRISRILISNSQIEVMGTSDPILYSYHINTATNHKLTGSAILTLESAVRNNLGERYKLKSDGTCELKDEYKLPPY